jgi:hypothetical protein
MVVPEAGGIDVQHSVKNAIGTAIAFAMKQIADGFKE